MTNDHQEPARLAFAPGIRDGKLYAVSMGPWPKHEDGSDFTEEEALGYGIYRAVAVPLEGAPRPGPQRGPDES